MRLTAPFLLSVPAAVKAASQCHGGIDLMVVQDTTGSFIEDVENVSEQIPGIVKAVNSQYPNTHFGCAEFKDKPYQPLGSSGEFCYKLCPGGLSPTQRDWGWHMLIPSGGGDFADASFQALVNVALDSHVGWRPLTAPGTEPDKNESAAHVVVLITDAVMHLPGDIAAYHQAKPGKYPELPKSLPPNSGKIKYPEAIDYECIYEDYPDAFQVRDALKSNNIYLILLTTDDPAITPSWKWFNDVALEQPPEFYQFIKNDSSDFNKVLLPTLDRVTEHACQTAAPTTEFVETTTTVASTSTTHPRSGWPPTTTYATPSPTTETSTTNVPTTTGASTSAECDCPHGPECPCDPQVLIRIGDKPKVLQFEMES